MKLKEEQQELEKYFKSGMKTSRDIIGSILGEISSIAGIILGK